MAKKKKNTTVNVGNALTIEHISRIRGEFDDIIRKSDNIEIVSEKLESFDLTGVQLIHYFKQQAEKDKKTIHIKLQFNNDQKKMIERNGFHQIIELIG